MEELNISNNQISEINILEKVNFKGLKELNLSSNEISDINILEKVNFKELKELDLSYNGIEVDWVNSILLLSLMFGIQNK